MSYFLNIPINNLKVMLSAYLLNTDNAINSQPPQPPVVLLSPQHSPSPVQVVLVASPPSVQIHDQVNSQNSKIRLQSVWILYIFLIASKR